MIDFIKLIWKKFKSLLITEGTTNLQCISTNTTQKLRILSNSCALTALSRAMPHLFYDEISDAFYNCCDQWPGAGVRHNEFNVVLRYLNIFDKFIYHDNSQKHLNFDHYLKNKGTYILLIPGHFTVLCNGKIYDSYGYNNNLPRNTKVYCSWMLSTGK